MKSLLARLLLVVSIALVPALAFQAYTESQAQRIRQQFMEDEALRLVRLVNAEQQRIAEGAEQALDTLSGVPAIQDKLPELCPSLLANLLAQSPRYGFASVIGLDGHLLCASVPFDAGVDLSNRAYFRDVLRTGGFVIGEYTVGRVTGLKQIPMAKPFRNRDGSIAGVLEIGLNLAWLGQQIEQLGLPPEVSVAIMDRNGTTLARRPDGDRFVGTPLSAENRIVLAGDKIAVRALTARDGRPRMVGYAPAGVEPKGLAVAVGLDRDVFFAGANQANRTGLLLIVIGAGWALVITALLGAWLIRRPFRRLLAVADHWRAGDLAARTELRAGGSEFARLGVAFDCMAEALQARETALRMALESTTDCVVVLDRAWRVTYLNEHAKALVPGRDLLGQILWDAVPGLAQTRHGDAYREAMDGGVPTHVEAYDKPLRRQFSVNAYPSRDGLTLFFHDVTEKRRVERRFRATFEQAAFGMALVDLDGAWLLVNDRLCAIVGRTRDELVAHGFQEITHPEDRALHLAPGKALLAGETASYTLEKRYLRKDGAVVWVNITVSLLHDPAGRPECTIGVIEDITERKRIEDELHQATALLRAIGNCSPTPIYAKDSDGRHLFANPATLAVLGRSLPEVIGRDDWALHPDAAQSAAVMANDQHVIETGRTEVREETLDTAGQGRRIFRSVKAPLLMEDGSTRGVVGLSIDITQLKDTEASLRRLTQDLELRVREEVAARQRQDMLMAELDHRVKNMLATIQALTVQSRSSADTLDGFLESFEGRLRAMSRAHSLLTQSHWDGADLHALIAGELAPYMGGAAPAVEIEAGAPALLKPKAALAFSLAVHELATNAARHGALSVPGGRVHIDWHAEPRNGRVLVLCWRETGGPDVAEPVPRGFGLTLIENSLAFELGGAVQLGFPAGGLACTVVMPWDQLASLAEPPAPPPALPGTDHIPAPLEGKRILLVEDNALLAATTVRQLEMGGASVVGPAPRLEAAIGLAKTAAIDAAILDVDLDGSMVWPAADCLRQRDIPFLFATGFLASLVMPPRFVDSPVVNKPYTARELRGALARLLQTPRSQRDRTGA